MVEQWKSSPAPVDKKVGSEGFFLNQEHTSLENSQPVLCAQCHYSPALDLAGTGPATSLPTFSNVMHAYHGRLQNGQGQPVFSATVDGNCYQCHPGRVTQCLRGAMATAGMDCFDCHGDRYEHNKASCKACHGTDLTGTPLSKMPVARTLRAEGRTVNFAAGDLVGCTHCHRRPSL